jgi:hypothetical protein
MSDPTEIPREATSPRARRIVLALIVLLPLLGLAPNLRGWIEQEPPESIFLGFWHMPTDHEQYGTFIAQARENGAFFMRDLLTTDPHPGRFMALYPWLVGRFAALTHVGDAEAWLILQYPVGVLLLIAAWFALGRLTRTPEQQVTAFLLATLASGVEWLAWVLMRSGVPLAYLVAPPFAAYWNWNLSGALAVPLWAIAEAVFLLLVTLLVAQLERATPWRGLALFACGPICWALHPYTGMAAFALVAAVPLMSPVARLSRAQAPDWRIVASRLRTVAPALLGAIPIAVESAWASGDPAVAHAMSQGVTWTTIVTPTFWPILYPLPLALGWFGFKACRTGDSVRDEILVGATVTIVTLSVNPWFSGSKFQYLLIVPICALAGRGASWLRENVSWFATAWHRRTPIAVLAIASIGTLLAPFADIARPADKAAAHASAGELEAMEFIRQQPGGSLLAPMERGALAAWKTLHPTYYGHFFLTVNGSQRQAETVKFFDPATDPAWRTDLLAKAGIRWVLVPPDLEGHLAETAWGRVAFGSGGWHVIEVARP